MRRERRRHCRIHRPQNVEAETPAFQCEQGRNRKPSTATVTLVPIPRRVMLRHRRLFSRWTGLAFAPSYEQWLSGKPPIAVVSRSVSPGCRHGSISATATFPVTFGRSRFVHRRASRRKSMLHSGSRARMLLLPLELSFHLTTQ
jgi:hypothetical protein